MAGEVIAVRAGQQSPEFWDASVFIAGSMPARAHSATSWQAEVVTLLKAGWTGAGRLAVFLSNPAEYVHDVVAEDLIDWDRHALDAADVVMVWWPDAPTCG